MKEIAASRKAAWQIVNSRRHDVAKVFSATNDASDLMWIGDAVLSLKNDKEVAGSFLAHLKLVDVNSENVRIKYFRAWGVGFPPLRRIPCVTLLFRFLQHTNLSIFKDSGPLLKILQEHPIPK